MWTLLDTVVALVEVYLLRENSRIWVQFPKGTVRCSEEFRIKFIANSGIANA